MSDELEARVRQAVEEALPALLPQMALLLAPVVLNLARAEVRSALDPLRSVFDSLEGGTEPTATRPVVPRQRHFEPAGTSLAVLNELSRRGGRMLRRDLIHALRPANGTKEEVEAADNLHLKAVRRLIKNNRLLLHEDTRLELADSKISDRKSGRR